MTRYLLDTNIVSELARKEASPSLLTWMASQSLDDLFISSMTLGEIQRGILLLPQGRKREDLRRWFEGPDGLLSLFAGRIIAFDHRAALIWARLMAEYRLSGRPKSPFDVIISAVGEANGCVIVTANERDFQNVPYVNPMKL